MPALARHLARSGGRRVLGAGQGRHRRRAAAGLALLACLAAPAARAEAAPRSVVTPEGLHVWEFPSSGAGSFSLVVLVDAGARDEEWGRTGLAHLTEHCLFRATTKRSTQDLLVGFREHHVTLNGETAQETTTYLFDAPASEWSWLVATVGEMLVSPALRESDIAFERAIVLEEIGGSGEDVRVSSIDSELYPDSAIAHDPSGSRRDVTGLEPAHVVAFHRRHYTRVATRIAWAGPVAPAECEAAIRAAFAGLPEDGGPPSRQPPDARRGAWIPRGLQQPEGDGLMMAGHHVPVRSAETLAALLVGAKVLGDECFRSMRTDAPLAYSMGVSPELHSDAWRLEFEAKLRKRDTMPAVVAALEAARAATREMDDRTFETARIDVLGRLAASDGPSLQRLTLLAWAGEKAEGEVPDLSAAVLALRAETTRATLRDVMSEANAFSIANDVRGLAGPPAGTRLLSFLGGAILVAALVWAVRVIHRRWQDEKERREVVLEVDRFLNRTRARGD